MKKLRVFLIAIFGLFMFIPVLYMYDGKKIKLNIFNKWIFYVFYPLHFIIIGIIKLLIN